MTKSVVKKNNQVTKQDNDEVLKTTTIRKIKALKVGTVFKNYPELCRALGLEVKKGTNAKDCQLKEIGRYVALDREGNKFIVTEVYKKAKPKENTKALQENLDIILKHYIYQKFVGGTDVTIEEINGKEHKCITLTKSKLARALGLINESNYQLLKYHPEAYKELIKELHDIELHDETIEEFINAEEGRQRKRLETAINGLERQGLVKMDKEGRGVIFTPIYTRQDIIMVANGQDLYYDYSKDTMYCNFHQSFVILTLEKLELNKMGLKTRQELYRLGKAQVRKFYKNVTKAINEYIDNTDEIEEAKALGKKPPKPQKLFSRKVKSYFPTYVMIYNELLEQECYNYRTLDLVIEAVNKIAVDSCETSVNTRYKKKCDRLKEIDRGLGINPNAKEIKSLKDRLPSYKEESHLMTKETINKNTVSRTKEVTEIRAKYEMNKDILIDYIIGLNNIVNYFNTNKDETVYNNEAFEIYGITRDRLEPNGDLRILHDTVIKNYCKDVGLVGDLSIGELDSIINKLIPLEKPKKDTEEGI